MRRRGARAATAGLVAAAVAWGGCGREVMALEETEYAVVERDEAFEVRRYAPHVVAETLLEGGFDSVGNEGFRRLAAYIGGRNRGRRELAMTAPVNQEPVSEKIPMTAPVNQERVGGRWRITFSMPSAWTLDTLPEPEDERVVLRAVPGQLMAAIRYSGTWSERRYREHEARLLEWVGERGMRAAGEPVFARYNPPFVPWFLRRNEVLVPVLEAER